MAKRTLLPEAVEEYLTHSMVRESPIQARLRIETAQLPEKDAGMQIGADQAAFFAILVKLLGARRALEIGTFTGYSALAVATALPADGRLIACDVSPEWTGIARRYWKLAGVADRIDLRLGPALDTLAALEREGVAGLIDFAFIDADKPAYDAYYEACLRLVRPGGLIALDNMLWSGAVVDPAKRDVDTVAIRELNRKISNDPRVDACLVSIGDGVMLARRRA